MLPANGTLSLKLERRQLLILATHADTSADTEACFDQPAFRPLPITLDWHAACERGSFGHVQPGDWQQWPGMELYCGEVTYTAQFTLNELPERLLLDLGSVRDLAVVTLNGTETEALLKPPFRCDVTQAVKRGVNQLSIRVISCLTSHYDHKPCPAGLLSEVRLLV